MTCSLLSLLIEFSEYFVSNLAKFFCLFLDCVDIVALKRFFCFRYCAFKFALVLCGNLIAVLRERFLYLEYERVEVILSVNAFLSLVILFCKLLSLVDSALDIFFGKVARRGDGYALLFASTLVFCRYVNDTVSVDVEGYFDLRNSTRSGSNTKRARVLLSAAIGRSP